jgi:2,7-dihydroxy-5-methyl-1-naphthoate 7-O-methyltransferase
MGRGNGADLETLVDLGTPWCIHVVATLGIAERIADGVDEVEALAAAAGCDATALHDVLSHLATKGVFEELAPGRFGLTETAQHLIQASPFLRLAGVGGRFAGAWGTLLTYVRTGQPGYAERFGLPFWEDLEAHPDLAAEFDALMGHAGHGVPDPDLPLTGGWEAVATVVDVGGGTGSMLAELLRANPELQGTLVDLPGTVSRAAPTFEAAGVTDRVTGVGQSFFDPLPAGADVYLLNKVLNDWPDRETDEILSRCADAVRPKGRILISGGVALDDVPRRLTHETVLVGGRTDTLTRFRQRATDAGLEVVAATSGPSSRLWVECHPA